MSFINPAAAWWLLLLPALLLLYIFRPRSVRLTVSSLRLWDKLPQVDRPRPRLRRPPLSLLLLMQLLLLGAGAFALLQPASEVEEGRHYILLLDASGSMQTRGDGATRWEEARREVRNLLGNMRDLDRVTLLRVGPRVDTACSLCSQAGAERALGGLRVGAGKADMRSALALASGLAGGGATGSVETIVISDGGFASGDEGLLPATSRYVQIGSEANNRGITRLSVRRFPDARPGYAAYARIDNGGTREANVQVAAFADTVPLPVRTITLRPAEHADLIWQVPSGAQQFTVNIGSSDALSADDTASVVLPSEARYPVGIVSANSSLYSRLVAGFPGLTPQVESAAGAGGFTIIEGSLTPTSTVGNALLINPRGEGFADRGEVENIRPVAAGRDHPLLDGVDLAALLVRRGPQLDVPAWLEPLVVSSAGTPLILAGERDGRRMVVLAFDPNESNLPKLAAFPLLFANAVDWLYPLASARALVPGETLYLAPGTQIRAPGERTLSVGGSGIFAETDEAGVYEIVPAGGAPQPAQPGGKVPPPLRFTVNMADPAESAIEVSAHPELERQAEVAAGRQTSREYWTPLAAAALVLLGLEWLFYCLRRGRI
jgi:Ca-activated chloride channel homolog